MSKSKCQRNVKILSLDPALGVLHLDSEPWSPFTSLWLAGAAEGGFTRHKSGG